MAVMGLRKAWEEGLARAKEQQVEKSAQKAEGPKQKVVEYEGEKALEKGLKEMLKTGWTIQSQTSYQPRAGLVRIGLLGFGAMVAKPKTKFVVVFTR